MSWKAIKKRIRSKTYHVASVMLSIGVTVETYSPEIKQVVAGEQISRPDPASQMRPMRKSSMPSRKRAEESDTDDAPDDTDTPPTMH